MKSKWWNKSHSLDKMDGYKKWLIKLMHVDESKNDGCKIDYRPWIMNKVTWTNIWNTITLSYYM
jgi:hypothetical protein